MVVQANVLAVQQSGSHS